MPQHRHRHTIGVRRTGPGISDENGTHYHRLPNGTRTSSTRNTSGHTHSVEGEGRTSQPLPLSEDDGAKHTKKDRKKRKKRKKSYSKIKAERIAFKTKLLYEKAAESRQIVPHVHWWGDEVTGPSVEVRGGHYHKIYGSYRSTDVVEDNSTHVHSYEGTETSGPVALEDIIARPESYPDDME